MTNEKPTFEQLTTMSLPDAGLRFNAQRVGPMDFAGLRDPIYGKGFRMPTIPELASLVYASLENKKEYKTAKNVVRTLKKYRITGNTGILYVPKGMFVQDNPELKNFGRISMDQKALEKKLGSHEEIGVKFSDDGSVRFTPYNFERKSQTPLKLSRNTGIIALVGGKENAEKLAKTSEHYTSNPFFLTFEDADSPQMRVAVLYNFLLMSGFGINADSDESFDGKYSFGVQKIKQEADLKK